MLGRWRLLSLFPLGLVALPQAAPPQQAGEAPPEVVLGRSSAIQPSPAPAEVILVTAGTRLYAMPDRRSALTLVAGSDAPRPVLERAGDWVLVRVENQIGWAAVAAGQTGPTIHAPPAADFLAARAVPLSPNPERLRRAHSLVASEAPRSIGPFALHADLADESRRRALEDLIRHFPSAYLERYRLEPSPADRFAIFVFADENAYRAFERADRDLAGLEARGHAAGNIAAVYARGERAGELPPILVHELTHLFNHSVFRGNLPAWLEEGMAEDLSFSRIQPNGSLDFERLGGVDRQYLEFAPDGSRTIVTELWGAPATLDRLVDALRSKRLLPLAELLSLSRQQMMRVEGRPLRYGQSAFLVRYLLSGAGADGRQALLTFLRRIAEGDGGDPAQLIALLDLDWAQLTRGYERWLVAQARAVRGRRAGTGR